MTPRRAVLVVIVLAVSACSPHKDPATSGDQPAQTQETFNELVGPTVDTPPTVSDRAADAHPTSTAPAPRATPTETLTTMTAVPQVAAVTDAFRPAVGRYSYDSNGRTNSGSGAIARTETAPTTQEDEVAITDESDGTAVTVTTRSGDDVQESEFHVTATQVTLRRLTYRATTTQTVRPSPPMPIAQLPYAPGSRQEFTWRDDGAGLQAVGTAEVERFESITTADRVFDCVLVHVNVRIRGAATGTIDLTMWLERTSGVQAKRRLLTSFAGAAGPTTTEVTAILRSIE